jgi:hypothetical protein
LPKVSSSERGTLRIAAALAIPATQSLFDHHAKRLPILVSTLPTSSLFTKILNYL